MLSSRVSARTSTDPALGELDGVANEVREDLAEGHGIPDSHRGHPLVHRPPHLDALLPRPRLERRHDVLDGLPDGEGRFDEREAARFGLAQLEHVVQEVQHVLGRGLQQPHEPALLRP